MTVITRAYAVEDMSIRSGGDGRTVEAYAAVFEVPTEIRDGQGHYIEKLARTTFDRTVQHRGTRFGVFYNHGKTLHGTPSERASVPLGSPIEPPKADGKGLLTVTRYNRTQQADEILEAIRNGDISGQSFSGRFVASDKPVPRGGFRANAKGDLVTVTRTEIAMTEYGPTPIPAYDVPMVVGVRSLAAQLTELDEEQRAELARMLGLATPLDPAQVEPDPATATATPDGLGAEDSQKRSGRLTPAQKVRLGLILRGA